MLRRLIEWFRSDLWRSATLITWVGLAVVLLLVAVGAADPAAEEEPEVALPEPTTLPDEEPLEEPEEEPEDLDVFFGGGYLAVKVDNAPGARPQVGLRSAKLLVEIPVEGGMTRFTAIYGPQATGLVGPLRSLRPVDADLLGPLAREVVSTGGRPFVIQAVETAGIREMSGGIIELFVSGGRNPPHDTFIELDLLLPGADIEDEATGFPFGEMPATTEQASVIRLPIGEVEFRFEDGVYVRYQSEEPFLVLDELHGEPVPLAHDTVVLLLVAERPAGYVDANQVPVSTFDVIGGGDLLVFHGGGVVAGSWSRSAQADPFVFLDTAGSPIGIPEGPTYVAIVPRDREVLFDAG